MLAQEGGLSVLMRQLHPLHPELTLPLYNIFLELTRALPSESPFLLATLPKPFIISLLAQSPNLLMVAHTLRFVLDLAEATAGLR